MMRFSIVIPVYNAQAYLRACLDSVVSQSFRDWEILLINDGSQDASGEICQKYAQKYPNIRYYAQENAGPSAARNWGIRQASGDYLMFLDSDDEISENALEKLDGIIAADHPDAIVSDIQYRTADGQLLPTRNMLLDGDKIRKSAESALGELAQKRYNTPASHVLIKRRILVEHNICFPERYLVGEDIFMMSQALCRCGSFSWNPEPYYIYNQNESSIIHTIRFDRAWHLTHLIREMLVTAQSEKEAQRRFLTTMASMLLVSFTQYYPGFSAEEKRKTREWMRENRKLLNLAAAVHPSTRFAGKLLGPGYAFLLAGRMVGQTKK